MTLRLFSLREIATGLGILASARRRPWMWGRVIGDAIDLLLLATALWPTNPHRRAAAIATANVLGVTALDVYTARELRARQ